MKRQLVAAAVTTFVLAACADSRSVSSPEDGLDALAFSRVPGNTGVLTANGWYEEEEIYYIVGGIEEGVSRRGLNEIYFIGGDRAFQANVVLFIPGERGYSPHWNVNVVHTAYGVTVQDIIDAGLASERFGDEPVLFDDAEDVLTAVDMGLLVLEQPGIVVLCPIISEEGAEAPGNTQLPEDEFRYGFDVNAGF
jgi:hypothetical protein